MSTFYKETNFESSQDLYDKRTVYKGELLQLSQRYSCLVDFNFAEKCLYGKVNRGFVSIEPNEVLTRFTKIPNIDSSVSRVEVINFVGHAFSDFLEDFSASVGKSFPITKSGFIRSRFNSILNNGISIEISDLTYTNDDQKINEFVNSPNFEYYLNTCNSFGFMVDIDAPWRIVADLESVAMQDYASRYGYNSIDAVLNIGFRTVHNSYFRTIPEELLNIYNVLASKFIDVDDCTGRAIIIRPNQYTLEQINSLYNEDYFLKLYCTLRFPLSNPRFLRSFSGSSVRVEYVLFVGLFKLG